MRGPLVGLVGPEFSALLRYQVVFFLLAAAVFWLVLGSKRFLVSVGFVLGYPVVWAHRILGYLVRRWERYLFLVPIIVTAAWYLRLTFALSVFYLASGLTVLVADSDVVLWLAGFVIATCLLWHYSVVVYRTYWNRPFEVAARFVQDADKKMSKETPSSTTGLSRLRSSNRERTPMGLVGMAYLAEIFALWFEKFSRGRKFELILPLAFLRTLVLTLVAFSCLYVAAQKIDPSAFVGNKDPSPMAFVAFSFDKLFGSDSATVRPASALAKVLGNAQAATTALIFVFFVFLLFTAQRDLTKEDLEELAANLRKLSQAARSQAQSAFGRPFEFLELEEFKKDPRLINNWRRRTGRAELKPGKRSFLLSRHRD